MLTADDAREFVSSLCKMRLGLPWRAACAWDRVWCWLYVAGLQTSQSSVGGNDGDQDRETGAAPASNADVT